MNSTTTMVAVAALACILTACGGSDSTGGQTAMVTVASEAPGTNCAAGGKVIHTGLDDNSNALLDADEYANTRYVCSSVGVTPVITVASEAKGAHCAAGGQSVTTSIDMNTNGQVDANEVIATSYVCNGVGTDPQGTIGPNGTSNLSTLSVLASGDAHCATGGARMDAGFDSNRNATLDPWEVATMTYACADGTHSTVTITSAANRPVSGAN